MDDTDVSRELNSPREDVKKTADNPLRGGDDRYRVLFETSSDAIMTLEPPLWNFTSGNPATVRLFGLNSEAEFISCPPWMLSPPYQSDGRPSQESAMRMIETAMKDGFLCFDWTHKRISGEAFSATVTLSRVEHAGKVFLQATVRDITKQKQAEEDLKKVHDELKRHQERLEELVEERTAKAIVAEEHYRQVVDNATECILVVQNGQIVFANPRILELSGYTRDELFARPFIAAVHPEDQPMVIDHHTRRLRGEDVEQYYQFRVINRQTGKIIWLELSAVMIQWEGKPATLSFATDVTERRRLQESLKESIAESNRLQILQYERELKDAAEARRYAEETTRAKSLFLANMSHEIRTPLNAILGFAQLMQRDKALSAESREHLDIINRSGEHLLALINDILEISKIEAGRSTFSPVTFDLHAFIQDIERMFRLRTDAKNLKFLLDKAGDIPQWVVTDEGKLRQILINLMGNAVKFTEEGGIVLRLKGTVSKPGTVNLQFEIEDTGPGMSEEEVGHLFQTFEQTASGKKTGGTGLGLALCRGFVQIMGGTISVTSTPGKGSIFRFEIPVEEDSEEHAIFKETKQRILGLMPGQDEIRVLIADDRETNRLLLSQLLAAAGFTTREAVNGEEAVRMALQWRPQVVLMDMAMPVMDGYEAISRIKGSAEIERTAIIAITASAFEEDKQRIFAVGADAYLAKPFKDAELFETIARLAGVQYLYEESDNGERGPATSGEIALLRGIVASLSPDYVNRMRTAIESADLDLLNELAAQLIQGQPTLARQVQEMAARYEYEALLKLFTKKE